MPGNRFADIAADNAPVSVAPNRFASIATESTYHRDRLAKAISDDQTAQRDRRNYAGSSEDWDSLKANAEAEAAGFGNVGEEVVSNRAKEAAYRRVNPVGPTPAGTPSIGPDDRTLWQQSKDLGQATAMGARTGVYNTSAAIDTALNAIPGEVTDVASMNPVLWARALRGESKKLVSDETNQNMHELANESARASDFGGTQGALSTGADVIAGSAGYFDPVLAPIIAAGQGRRDVLQATSKDGTLAGGDQLKANIVGLASGAGALAAGPAGRAVEGTVSAGAPAIVKPAVESLVSGTAFMAPQPLATVVVAGQDQALQEQARAGIEGLPVNVAGMSVAGLSLRGLSRIGDKGRQEKAQQEAIDREQSIISQDQARTEALQSLDPNKPQIIQREPPPQLWDDIQRQAQQRQRQAEMDQVDVQRQRLTDEELDALRNSQAENERQAAEEQLRQRQEQQTANANQDAIDSDPDLAALNRPGAMTMGRVPEPRRIPEPEVSPVDQARAVAQERARQLAAEENNQEIPDVLRENQGAPSQAGNVAPRSEVARGPAVQQKTSEAVQGQGRQPTTAPQERGGGNRLVSERLAPHAIAVNSVADLHRGLREVYGLSHDEASVATALVRARAASKGVDPDAFTRSRISEVRRGKGNPLLNQRGQAVTTLDQSANVLEAPGKSLSFQHLKRNWEKANGERLKPQSETWQQLEQRARKIDEQRGNTLYQGDLKDAPTGKGSEKGAVSFAADGRAVLHALKNPDISTAIHELFHVFRRTLDGRDADIAAHWAGAKRHQDGTWSWGRAAEERLARAGERYVREGVAPTKALQGVFDKLKSWLSTIYQSIRGTPIDVEMSPEMRQVFQRMFTPAKGHEAALNEHNMGKSSASGHPDTVEGRIAATYENYEQARADYDKLHDSDSGRVLNVDTARELSKDYAASRESRNTLAPATHEAASGFIKKLYMERLETAKPGDVLFLAGGGGSGKSTVLRGPAQELNAKASIIMDAVLSDFTKAEKTIQAALMSGRKVSVVYVHTPFNLAAERALKRSQGPHGRSVPLEVLAKAHAGANDAILRLHEKYANNPNVDIRAFDNTGKAAVPISIAELKSQRYTPADGNTKDTAARLIEGLPEGVRAGYGTAGTERPAPRSEARDQGSSQSRRPEATKQEPVEVQKGTTGISNEMSAETRKRLGLPDRETPDGRTFDEMYSEGKKKAEAEPNSIPSLIEELRRDPERIVRSDTEVGMLLKHKVDLENDLARLRKAADAAHAAGDLNGELEARANLANQRAAMVEFTELMERSGTAAGRALVARKMMSAMDYSLSHMEAEAAAAKGSPLTDVEAKKVDILYQSVQKANEAAQKRSQAKINELEGKMKARDFSKPYKPPVPRDPETLRLQAELEGAKRRYREMVTAFEKANRTKLRKVADFVGNLPGQTKSLKASLDNSAVFRQGWRVMFTNPIIWQRNALRTFADAFKVLGGKHVMDAVHAELKANPYYEEARRAKLSIVAPEEDFPVSLPAKIPVLGRVFRASEEAYTAFQYRNRMQVFERMMKVAEKSGIDTADLKQLRSIAKVVNSLTSRGHLGKLEPVGNVLNNFFFSARKLKADWDFLTVHSADTSVTAFARKQALYNLVKVVSGTAMILAIANAVAPGSVETDPRSAGFGKIKAGNTRYDVTGGVSPILTLAARLLTGSTKSATTGKIRSLNDGKFGSQTRADVIGGFFGNKLSPAASVVLDHMRGRTFAGKPPTMSSDAWNLLVPMAVTNFLELQQDTGATPSSISAGVLADFMGIGTNTYDAKKPHVTHPTK